MKFTEEQLLAFAEKLISEWNDYALPVKVIEYEATKAVKEFIAAQEEESKKKA